MKETRIFKPEKATKNTMRFEEIIEEGKAPLLRTIYIQSYSPLSREKVILVTVESADATE